MQMSGQEIGISVVAITKGERFMKYSRFEDVPVWQAGIRLTADVFKATEDRCFRNKGDIANQIQRAALSIPNNIAEGFERGTKGELMMFLFYSKGSAGEVRSICHVIGLIGAFDHMKPEICRMRAAAEEISRQLSAWCSSLQESEIKGVRYLTDKSKQAFDDRKKGREFLADLKKKNDENFKRLMEQRQKSRNDAGSGLES